MVKKIKKDVSDVKNTREGILHKIKSILFPVLLTDNHNILHGKLGDLDCSLPGRQMQRLRLDPTVKNPFTTKMSKSVNPYL